MLREQVLLYNRLLGVVDVVLLALSLVFASLLTNLEAPDLRHHIWLLTLALPIWIYFLAHNRLYSGVFGRGVYDVLTSVLSVHIIGGSVLAGLLYILHLNQVNRNLYLYFLLCALVLFSLSRLIARRIMPIFSCARERSRNIIIVGAKDKAQEFYRLIQKHSSWGINTLGFVQVDVRQPQKDEIRCRILGPLAELIEICKKHPVDEVIFCPPRDFPVNVDSYVKDLEELGVTVHLALDFYDVPQNRTVLSMFHDQIPLLTYYSKVFDSRQLFLKRLLDICGALVGLLITVLFFPVIACAIKKDSPGPLFFGQKRVGRNGRSFRCWKFRSMYIDAEERKQELMSQNEMNGAIFKIKNDPRITKVGAFLRKSSLDELPQFWNVLKGEMSLVGTRPPTPDEVAQYENWHRRRICIKPGITGSWQVSGRNKIDDFDAIVNLDLQYIDNWSIRLDIKILVKTVLVVFAREGSS